MSLEYLSTIQKQLELSILKYVQYLTHIIFLPHFLSSLFLVT